MKPSSSLCTKRFQRNSWSSRALLGLPWGGLRPCGGEQPQIGAGARTGERCAGLEGVTASDVLHQESPGRCVDPLQSASTRPQIRWPVDGSKRCAHARHSGAAGSLAGVEVMALSEYAGHLLRADAGEELSFRAGGLDDDDLGFEALAPRRCRGARAGCRTITARPSLSVGLHRQRKVARRRRSRRTQPPLPRSVPSMKFIAGEPMKPATKRFAGRS